MKNLFKIIFVLAFVLSSCGGSKVFNICEYGAVGDGVTIDSDAIDKAIEAAAEAGGGVVRVPEGIYACHTIHLANNVDLLIEEGAVIKAASHTIGAGYDAPEENPFNAYQDFGHSHWCNSLIYGIGLENITISGGGIIDGELLSDGFTFVKKSTSIDCDFTLEDGAANKAIALKECRNVTLKDITISRGGHFALLATGVDGLVIEGLTVDTNRDGLDIDCCKDVMIRNCTINSCFDDAVVLKTSYALGRYKPCENITISNCKISGYLVGSLLDGTKREFGENRKSWHSGRIKLGTESSGDYRNIKVNNCSLEYCGGLHVESTDGALIENISFSDITIDRCTDSPIFVMIGSRLRSPEGKQVGTIRGVEFKNITSKDARADYGVIVTGYRNNKVYDITFDNVTLHSVGGMSCDNDKVVLEIEKQYPDPKTFGKMPSSGLYLRHVDGAILRDLNFSFTNPDSRPVIIKEDCVNIISNNQ